MDILLLELAAPDVVDVADGEERLVVIVVEDVFQLRLLESADDREDDFLPIAILNVPFIYLGYKQIGKSFAILSVTGIASLSIGTVVMHHVPTIIEGDALLITVVGGIIIGLGMGLALRNGGALDGIDMLAVLLSRKLPFSTSDLILFLNAFVFIVVSTVFGLQGAVLSAIAYFIASKVIHIVEEGLSGAKTFNIIRAHPTRWSRRFATGSDGA